MKSLSLRGIAVRYGARTTVRKVVSTLAGLLLLVNGAVAQEQITIAALGDSLTQGYGLAPEDGFVPQLQAWLRAEGQEVTVLNAGVSGDTTAGGLARVDWTLSDDVDAVIVALGGNDLLRGIDPAVSRANLDAILQKITAKGLPVLLAGLPAPTNYGPEFKQSFDAMFPQLAETYGALYYENFLGGLGSAADLGAARALMQADGIHPNAKGVEAIVADIGPMVAELVRQARP